MDEKNQVYYESKKLAQAFITELSSEIKIPSKIYEALKPIGKNLVAVIPGDSKKLSFFLTDADLILFVKLLLDKSSLNEGFFTSLRKTLKNLNLKNLFSTGICFKDEVCVWEGVFEISPGEDLSLLEKEMAQILHVNRATIEQIELGNFD